MSHPSDTGSPAVVSNRVMEIVVAGLFALVAVVVMADSVRVGNGWAPEGPQAGYFPFYVGLIMFISSLVTLVTNLLGRTADKGAFVERDQLGLVMQVLLPSIAFVAVTWFLGIYVGAALFIAGFMRFVGHYPLRTIVPIAVGVPVALFVMFEVWFLVPLPKGPLEAMLGY